MIQLTYLQNRKKKHLTLSKQNCGCQGERWGVGINWTFLVAQTVKNLAAVWETWVRSLGWEDPLEEDMATHSSILAWRIPTDGGAWRATVHGVTKSCMTEQLRAGIN